MARTFLSRTLTRLTTSSPQFIISSNSLIHNKSFSTTKGIFLEIDLSNTDPDHDDETNGQTEDKYLTQEDHSSNGEDKDQVLNDVDMNKLKTWAQAQAQNQLVVSNDDGEEVVDGGNTEEEAAKEVKKNCENNIVTAVNRLMDEMMLRRMQPAWLNLVPGASYYVPPRKEVKLEGLGGFGNLFNGGGGIGGWRGFNGGGSEGGGGFRMMSGEEMLSGASRRGCPSSEYFCGIGVLPQLTKSNEFMPSVQVIQIAPFSKLESEDEDS